MIEIQLLLKKSLIKVKQKIINITTMVNIPDQGNCISTEKEYTSDTVAGITREYR